MIGAVDALAAQSLLGFVEEAGPGLAGLDRRALFEQLEARYGEMLAAIGWFLEQGRSDEAIRVSTSLAPFWMATGRLDEGSAWFARVLALPGAEQVSRGRGCFEAGLLAFWRGDDDVAAALHGEALEIGRAIDDPTVTALALTGLARISLRANVAEARRLCEEALAVTNGTGERLGRSNALHVLGVAAQMSGDLLAARELMSERMALARELGSYSGVAAEAGNLSAVERQLGNLDRAEALAREALEITVRREDEWALPYDFNALAAISAERGDLERAATLIGAAETTMDAQEAAWPPDERVHYERTLEKLADATESARLEHARATGRSLSSQEAVEFALATN